MIGEGARRRLSERLRAVAETPGAELSGLALGIVADGKPAFEAYVGRRFIDPADPSRDLPVDRDTRFRVASISKTFTAAAVMLLAERGLLDLEGDVSDLLGFRLRNPAWPERRITPAMLLSHSSSLRDGESYNLPLGRSIREFFEPGTEAWEGGAHFASPRGAQHGAWAAASGPPDLGPGSYFSYCNLGFGLLGTMVERVSGRRFDRFMLDEILRPAGLGASFNVNLLTDEAFGHLAALYRKGGEEAWDPEGPWIPQVDDYRGQRPASPCRLSPGLGTADLEAYRPGENGTLFSPQGGLRASIPDLMAWMGVFLDVGSVEGRRILSRESVEAMWRPRWIYDPSIPNGEPYYGLTRMTGLGLCGTTASWDGRLGDRLLPSGGPRLWGHHADAYGLLGGMLFSPGEGWGFCYLIGGVGRDPEVYRGSYSSWFRWEEEIQRAVLEETGLGA